jgi:hypothetical protein
MRIYHFLHASLEAAPTLSTVMAFQPVAAMAADTGVPLTDSVFGMFPDDLAEGHL